MTHIVQTVIGDRVLSIQTGKLANQAGAAVVVSYNETIVLVTVCVSGQAREGVDFLPLTIDYEERLYAAGKIPGGYFKREGRPSQEAILTMRLTDRPLRPLFPKNYHNDVQIIITVLSADQENDPDSLAIVGASSALGLSQIPFTDLIAASRVGYVDGKLILNPTFTQLLDSSLDIIVAGTYEAVTMVEAGANEVSEEILLEAIQFGQKANQEIISLQRQLIQVCGKEKHEVIAPEKNSDLYSQVSSIIGDRFSSIFSIIGKMEQADLLAELKTEVLEKLENSFNKQEIVEVFEDQWKREVREKILRNGLRVDGRKLTEVRPISSEVGVLPRPHGSGLFTRGETQVLTITTLGSQGEGQRLNGIGQEESKRFMHHYNFPPFSVGEVRRIGTPGRREIGHGALAERALYPVIPSEDNFPYTIRLVSEVLSSNGSSSMASVCGSTLSLMDAGVPIVRPVAGVAMGLIKGDQDNYAILTDINGTEDHLGDMDFKVAGTTVGITALQMDIKITGISSEIMAKALNQAREARLFILEKMKETIGNSRTELSKYAPRMVKISINPEKIGSVIGPKGKTIRSIIDETKTTVDIQDDGSIWIGSSSEEATKKAIAMIEGLTREVEAGAIYTGKVTRVTNFGAFVEVIPGKEGLVHISKLADYRVANVEDVVKVGDEIMVQVTDIDHMGRINLSRRAVFEMQNKDSENKNETSSDTRRSSSHYREGKDNRRQGNTNRSR